MRVIISNSICRMFSFFFFFQAEDGIRDKLVTGVQTCALPISDNPFTIAVSGTGSAGMEAALVNLIEPGDTMIVGVNGVVGPRMAGIVGRAGGQTLKIEVPWGQNGDPHRLEETLEPGRARPAVAL